MSKYRNKKLVLFVVIALGIAIISGGLFMRVKAYDPASETDPGKRLDLVYNLYYRYMHKESEHSSWEVEDLRLLGRYYGGYVIGFRYCSDYDRIVGTDYFQCTNSVLAHGFGIIYQVPNGMSDADSIHMVIPMPWSSLQPDAQARKIDFEHEYEIMPWFDYKLEDMTNPIGHEFSDGVPIGYVQNSDDSLDGYVSLEIRTDLEDLPGPDDFL